MNVALKARESKAPTRININREWCKGCGICVAFCPKKVLEMDRQDKPVVRHLDECNGCGMCELRCPDMAIEVMRE